MSCSTTSLLAGTTTNTLITEDPYVFTETVPTTPPTLFNNSQKSRNRFESKQQQNATTNTTVIKNQVSNKKSVYVKLKNYGTQTQTPSTISSPPQATAINSNAPPVLGVINTNNIKYGPQAKKLQQNLPQHHQQQQQLPQQQQKQQTNNFKNVQNVYTAQNENDAVQQRQRQQQQHQQQQKQLSTTPPPLLLSHTPSLWQTPLLLDNATTSTTSTTTTSKITTSTTNPSKMATIKHTLESSTHIQAPTLAATGLITPITSAAGSALSTSPTVTPIGNIAPLHLIMPTAAPLPPSNFHHTTLAQHLQKLQCLKKPKKLSPTTNNTGFSQKSIAVATTPIIAAVKETDEVKALATPTATKVTPKKQHSTTDLNDIPVNVIFRSPTSKANKNLNSKSSKQTAEVINNQNEEISGNKPKSTLNEKSSIITSKPAQAQKRNNVQQTKLQPTQQKQRKLQNCIPKSVSIKPCEIIPSSSSINPIPNATKSLKSIGKRCPKLPNPKKPQKRCRKTNLFPTKFNERTLASALDLVPDILLSTKAVAIVKKPYNEVESDAALLYNENELPYCVQKYWFNIQADPTLKNAYGREDRITEYKSALRRQAMQMLATRSLQRLPFHVARKRLLCVDTLLRKYRDQNKSHFNFASRKQCEIELCENIALEMTTFCRQHIVRNTKQSLFVACSAKSFNNYQKPCDVPVLNIQKHYTQPICYLHRTHRQNIGNDNNTITDSTTNVNDQSHLMFGKQCKQNKQITPTRRSRKSAAIGNAVQPLSEAKLQLANRTNSLQRKNSTTSLESIASNSHSSFASSIQQQSTTISKAAQHQGNIFNSNMLSPPALAPLSYNSNDNHCIMMNSSKNNTESIDSYALQNRQNHRHFSTGTIDPAAEQEINKLVAQFAMAAAATASTTKSNNTNNNNNNFNSFNFMNTNSNSNLTSSGVGSSSSLPSTDEFLTQQDVLSNCENSSAYASSSEDTGLGELSESELMAASNGIDAACSIGGNVNGHGNGGGFNVDDVSPDEIPLGDTRLLEETDLVNVFGTLPVNLNELFNSVVQQDEREEIERALEIADKHLKTLQQTIGSDTDFLADFLNGNEDMLADTDDICSKMEIISSVLPPNESGLDAAALYLENADSLLSAGDNKMATNVAMSNTCVASNSANNNTGVMDIRGLLQT